MVAAPRCNKVCAFLLDKACLTAMATKLKTALIKNNASMVIDTREDANKPLSWDDDVLNPSANHVTSAFFCWSWVQQQASYNAQRDLSCSHECLHALGEVWNADWTVLSQSEQGSTTLPSFKHVPYSLHTILLQHEWPAMEGALYEITSMHLFADLSMDNPNPDHSTIMNFRHLL